MKRSTAILAWLFMGCIGTIAACLTVRSVVRGEYPSALAALGGSVFCYGLITPLAKVVRGKQTPRVNVDDDGTTFRPDPGIDIPVQVSLIGGVVAGGLVAVLVPLGKLDIPIPSGLRYAIPFMAALIVVIGAPMLWRNISRGGTTKYLRLSTQGFELSEGLRSASGDWAQVEEISDQVPTQQARSAGDAVVFVMSDKSAHTIAAGAMTPDGSAVRELVRFYWKNPESRGELTDGRALERLIALIGAR